MSKPTQEQIARALEWAKGPPIWSHARILADLYYSEHDRAELLERHYREAVETNQLNAQAYADMLIRHMHEREALE